MEAKELAVEYKQQAKIIQEKIEALKPLALIYKGADLEVLKKKLKILQDMQSDCVATANLLEDF